MGLLDQAAGAVADDERVAKRVWLARRAIDFVWLDRYDELKNEAQAKGMPFLGPSNPARLVDELAPYANRWEPHKEGSGFPIYFDRLRKKFPSRESTHHWLSHGGDEDPVRHVPRRCRA